jgi:hypothetical protein
MKLKPLSQILAATLLTLVAVKSEAQLGASAAFTAARLSSPQSTSSPTTIYGPTLSLYYQKGTFLALGGDVRASFLNASGVSLNTVNIGPRAALKLHPLPLQIYAEALGGFNSFTPRTGDSSSHHFDYQLLGGLDATVFPRLDWRVLEYAYTGSTDSLHAASFSTGLVFRIPTEPHLRTTSAIAHPHLEPSLHPFRLMNS